MGALGVALGLGGGSAGWAGASGEEDREGRCAASPGPGEAACPRRLRAPARGSGVDVRIHSDVSSSTSRVRGRCSSSHRCPRPFWGEVHRIAVLGPALASR